MTTDCRNTVEPGPATGRRRPAGTGDSERACGATSPQASATHLGRVRIARTIPVGEAIDAPA